MLVLHLINNINIIENLEKHALIKFITDTIGAPIRALPKSSTVDITISYLFNGWYDNAVVNFIRAYDLMKQYCKMQLVQVRPDQKSYLGATIAPGSNIDFQPLKVEASSINLFRLDDVMQFVQKM